MQFTQSNHNTQPKITATCPPAAFAEYKVRKPKCLGPCLPLFPKVYSILSPSCHFSYMCINPPMAHTHRQTHTVTPWVPG